MNQTSKQRKRMSRRERKAREEMFFEVFLLPPFFLYSGGCVCLCGFNSLMRIYTFQSSSSLTFPFSLLSHFALFFSSPLSSSCIFPQFGVTSVLNTPHLLHLKLFFTAETLSLRRIKRTNLLTNSKHRATLLMSAALLSSCFVFPSFIFLPCPPLPTLFFCLRAVT